MKITDITGKEYILTEEEEKFCECIKDMPVAYNAYLEHLLMFAEEKQNPKIIKKKMEKKRIWLFVAAAVVLILAAALLGSCKNLKSPNVTDNDEVEQLDTTPPSIQEVLNRRESFRHMCYVDSIYLDMPEDIFINILINKGTELTQEMIVEEYLTHYEYYTNLLKQLKLNRQYVPDSVPKQSFPEQKADSIIQALK